MRTTLVFTLLCLVLSAALHAQSAAQDPGAGLPAADVNTQPPAQAAAPSSSFLLAANPLGFLQFGPTVEAELLAGRKLGIMGGFRLVTLGLMSHLINDDLNSAWTAAGALRFYLSDAAPAGWFAGPRAELGKSDREFYRSDILGGALEAGHRWVFHDGVTLQLGGMAGGFKADYEHKEFPDDTGTERYFFIMGILAVGLAL